MSTKLTVETSYNITYDEMADPNTGHLAYLLAKTLYEDNLSYGLESGEPFIAPKGVIVSNSLRPSPSLVVISINTPDSTKEEINITEDISEITHYLLVRSFSCKVDIRRVKALTKGYKKTQTYRKYLKCFYILVMDLSDEEAESHIRDMIDFGLPFYVKVNKIIEILGNLTMHNLRMLLFYRNVWGEENLTSIYLYIVREQGLPEYISSQHPELLHSATFKTNLINFGLALGKGELNKFILQRMIEI